MKNTYMDKKGMAGKSIDTLISAVILILFAVVVAPVIFGSSGLNSSDLTTNAPAWVVTLLSVIVGIGLVVLIYRGFSGKK